MSTFAIPSSADNRIWRIAGIALLSVWLMVLTAQTVRVAIATPPSFDGAMNLEVARSLSQGEGYRRLYADRQPFPHEIQTNAPYILPAAATFAVLGVGIAQTEFVSIAYLLASMALAALLARRFGGWWLSGICSVVLLTTPGLLKFGIEGYGEIPALTWFFAAVLVYFTPEERPFIAWRSILSGLFLALAVLTKTVMLLCVGGFAACVLLQAIFHHAASTKRAFFFPFAILAGAVPPVFAFEKWKEMAVGGRHAWHEWWHYEGHAIADQAGVQHSPHTLGALVDKIGLHLNALAHACNLPLWLVVAWVTLLLVASLIAILLATRDRKALGITAILCVAMLYFVWWLVITPDAKTWLRRILDGIVCANLGLVLLAGHLIRAARERLGIPRYAAAFALSAVPAVLLVIGTIGILEASPPDNSRLLEVVQRVKSLPRDAYLFGIGWDSSPLISVLSGRHFADFNDMPTGGLDVRRPIYLVRSRGLPSTEYINATFSLYGVRLGGRSNPQAADDAGINEESTAVYRLPALRPIPIGIDKGPVQSRIQYTDEYPYLKGPYPAEPGNGRWLKTDNVVVLQPTSSGLFFLSGYAVPQKRFKYSHPVKAEISFDGCPTPPQPVPTGSNFTLEVHALDYCKLDVRKPWTVRIEVDNVVDSGLTQDERELSILLKSMGFR